MGTGDLLLEDNTFALVGRNRYAVGAVPEPALYQVGLI